METKEIIVIIILFIFIFGFSYYYNKNINKVCFKENCFIVEIADTDEKRAQGLMFRKYLEENKGMFFVFEEEGIYPFWMKNTLIPLDIIWINSNKEIVFIKENALPCKVDPCESIDPKTNALYVLEVNSNIVKETGIKIGDKVRFK